MNSVLRLGHKKEAYSKNMSLLFALDFCIKPDRYFKPPTKNYWTHQSNKKQTMADESLCVSLWKRKNIGFLYYRLISKFTILLLNALLFNFCFFESFLCHAGD